MESGSDTTVILDDGTRFVIGQSLDELIRIVRDHRAAEVSARRSIEGPAGTPGAEPERPPRFRGPGRS